MKKIKKGSPESLATAVLEKKTTFEELEKDNIDPLVLRNAKIIYANITNILPHRR